MSESRVEQELREKLRWHAEARDALRAEVDRLSGQLDDIAEAIGDHAFLDPPDGGYVSLAEQVRRMREALARSAPRLAVSTGATVRARIAVAVDERGDWHACGWPEADHNAMQFCLDGLKPRDALTVGQFWLEADLPVPAAPVITARVLEDDAVCGNCGVSLPTGCQGLFQKDGQACWLNRNTKAGHERS